MIFKEEDFTFFETTGESRDSNGNRIKKQFRLHNPTGVYFLFSSYPPVSESENFVSFAIGAISKDGEILIDEIEVFTNPTQFDFFEAVKYFESLIEKKQPQPEQEDLSVGVFVFIKNEANLPNPDSFADVFDNIVIIDKDDVAKVFAPPVNKKYGRLNMYAVEDEKYDVIKGKFALKYDQELSDINAEKLGRLPTFGVAATVFAYKMIPYDTSEDGDKTPAPEKVNDESLTLDQIEGETPIKMEGNSDEREDDDKADQDGVDEGDGDEAGDDGDGEGEADQDGVDEGDVDEAGDDGDGEGEADQDGVDEGEVDEAGDDGDGEGEADQDGVDEGDVDEAGDDGDGEGEADQDGVDEGDGERYIRNKDIMDGLSKRIPKSFWSSKERLIKFFESYSQQELKDNWYTDLKVNENTSKADFIEETNLIIDNFNTI